MWLLPSSPAQWQASAIEVEHPRLGRDVHSLRVTAVTRRAPGTKLKISWLLRPLGGEQWQLEFYGPMFQVEEKFL